MKTLVGGTLTSIVPLREGREGKAMALWTSGDGDDEGELEGAIKSRKGGC